MMVKVMEVSTRVRSTGEDVGVHGLDKYRGYDTGLNQQRRISILWI